MQYNDAKAMVRCRRESAVTLMELLVVIAASTILFFLISISYLAVLKIWHNYSDSNQAVRSAWQVYSNVNGIFEKGEIRRIGDGSWTSMSPGGDSLTLIFRDDTLRVHERDRAGAFYARDFRMTFDTLSGVWECGFTCTSRQKSKKMYWRAATFPGAETDTIPFTGEGRNQAPLLKWEKKS